MERKAKSDRLRKTPSPNPQRVDKACWYYEGKAALKVVTESSFESVSHRIPWRMLMESARRCGKTKRMTTAMTENDVTPRFRLGDRVRKTKGSSWQGRVVGTYRTSLTPEGYAVESEREPGSVQIYPAAALEGLSHD